MQELIPTRGGPAMLVDATESALEARIAEPACDAGLFLLLTADQW